MPSSTFFAISETKTGSPRSIQRFLKRSLSSALSILLIDVPKISTLHSSSTPFFASCIARFNPVCPPIPGMIASGLSWRMIFATASRVSGSIYTLWAIEVSVIIVAGFEFTRTTS